MKQKIISEVMRHMAKKRWRAMTKEQRSEVGRKRVRARWDKRTALAQEAKEGKQ